MPASAVPRLSSDFAQKWVDVRVSSPLATFATYGDVVEDLPVEAANAPEEVVVSAPEPRYVAPTLRDRIGRFWAPVYEACKMNNEPAMLIGMDIIGLLDSLIIDYKRKELHLRARS